MAALRLEEQQIKDLQAERASRRRNLAAAADASGQAAPPAPSTDSGKATP